jgi:hypothetical protein
MISLELAVMLRSKSWAWAVMGKATSMAMPALASERAVFMDSFLGVIAEDVVV